jgi:hypothetical protein
MSNTSKEVLGFGGNFIRVVIMDISRRCEIRLCSVDGNKVTVEKDVTFTFKTEQVGSVWVRTAPSGRHSYNDALLWRSGHDTAMDWWSKDDFMSPLTEQEIGKLVKRMVAEQKAKDDKGMMKGWQIALIVIMLSIVLVVLLLLLFGVQLNVGSATQTTTPIVNATVTPLPPIAIRP